MKLSVKFHNLLTMVMSTVMGLLGFSCESWTEPECMYGTPSAEYEVKGKVTDINGQPVKVARIMVGFGLRVQDPFYNDNSYVMHYPDTVYTNAQGEYLWHYRGFPYGEDTWVKCEAPDTNFEPDSMKLKFDMKNPGSWYEGKGTETVNFTLKYKAENPE